MGLIHVYFGDGKGKTTAAVGLSVRARGSGLPVLFQQYLKDGSSSELDLLRQLGIEVTSGQPEGAKGFTWELNTAHLALLRTSQDARLEEAFTWLAAHPDGGLLVLDETLASVNLGLLDASRLYELMDRVQLLSAGPDLVLTGRDPSDELRGRADYLSEIRLLKHPFEKGIAARRGIEF